MQLFFVFVGAWLIGWGILLASLFLRTQHLSGPPGPEPSNTGRRGHALTLLDTTEVDL